MDAYRIPPTAQIGRVQLKVSGLGRSLHFYERLLGFRVVAKTLRQAQLSATGSPPVHLVLHEHPGAIPKPPGTTGLFHLAIRYPGRRELAQALHRLLGYRWPIGGFSDHQVSEAIYLVDPDGLGVELYADRPPQSWPRAGDFIAMTTQPLDLEDLLAQYLVEPTPWDGIHPATDIGHIHLQVADLSAAEILYAHHLGLTVTQRDYPGALFLSAGGYHHHVGLNVWAGQGAPLPPPQAVGLRSFSLQLPDAPSLQALTARLGTAGVELVKVEEEGENQAVSIDDPNGFTVELRVD